MIARRIAHVAAAALAVAAGAAGPAAASEPAVVLDEALARLDGVSAIAVGDGWRFREDGPGAADSPVDRAPWIALPAGNRAWSRGWFARAIEIPSRIGGYDVAGMRVWLSLRVDGEGQAPLSVYAGGRKLAEVDDGRLLEPILLAPAAQAGRRVLLRVKTGIGGAASLVEAQLFFDREGAANDPRDLRNDLLAARALLAAPGAPADGAGTLQAASTALDWSGLAKGDQRAFDRSMGAARERLGPFAAWMRRFRVIATGTSSIDMASLWPWTETIDVTRRTFGKVLDLMGQYPDLVFAQSSAQTYAWMEEKYPDLYRQIRDRVREGRWEPVGGMWVEPDLELVDGESLARQLLFGQRYFIEKLGRPARLGWSPGPFAASWQLPQLYRAAGIDALVTRAPAGDAVPAPGRLFWWEAPNGTRLLTARVGDTSLEGAALAADVAAHLRDAPFPEVLRLFGGADHGGGPTRATIDAAHALGAGGAVFPRVDLGPARGFFDHALGAAEQGLALPVWRDELSAPNRGGAYTSNGAVKQANRRAEALLLEAERFAALAGLYGDPYPEAELRDGWRKVLFNQFRDIVGGTGIAAVRQDAALDHAEVRRLLEPIRRRALETLAAHADTRGAGTAVVVANPLPWTRTAVVEAELPAPGELGGVSVNGPGEVPAPADLVARDGRRHTARVRFVASDVPPLGVAVYHVRSGARPWLGPMGVRVQGGVLENEQLRVTVDLGTGCVTSLYDKHSKTELVPAGACANELQAFSDQAPGRDALVLDPGYARAPVPFDPGVEVKVVERGPLRAAVRVVRLLRGSRFMQEISLDARAARVDVTTDVEWQERHVVVKAAFPTTVDSDSATFEIPYGTVDRPTGRRAPAGAPRPEVAALRWADLADARHGLLVVNDGRAGTDVRGGVMRLTLVRGPTWPDPHVDEGHHHFVYALAPHAGDWRQAGAVRRGYELNQPLIAFAAASHAGTLPAKHGFVQVSPDNVVLSALKQAEDDDGLVVRLYETAGETASTRLRVLGPVASAEEVDLLERRRRPLPVRDGVLTVELGPYEVTTVRLRMLPPLGAYP